MPEESGHARPEPPPVPAARRRDGVDELEHAEPGADWPTLCGIPADEVDLYRHTFFANRPDDCPVCAERVWRLDPSGPLADFLSLVWADASPAVRLPVRASSSREVRELLLMRFGESTALVVCDDDAAGQALVAEAELLARADEVVVISGAGFDAKDRRANRRLAVEKVPTAIVELITIVTDRRPGDRLDLMEWPQVSVAFLADRRLLAEYGVLGGGPWIRTATDGDQEVRGPQRLRAWLDARGVPLDGAEADGPGAPPWIPT